ncbi:tetratricopeptide repeat protein [Sneathiella glossodoripedis]|uniref:tetratricopeptide repeat protein n=1 Tax=Sneathiella glossodoripedis TaxID=418853 RepID=UPI00047154C1|nr:tetratricopeptide repeat protein [Sneathiella glossodoripedis]
MLANKSSKWFKYNDQIRHPTMFLIGYIYENGLGLEGKDQKTAFEWYLRAANSGYSFAQYKIGEAYYFGHVYEVNHTFAESWLKLAADKEVADAMLLLAEMYNAGHGEEADKALAESYIERARMSKNKISTILRYQGAISND